jgi:predicted acylesterase/phospholipase RssA
MGKIIAVLFLAMWAIQLLSRAADAFARWQRDRNEFRHTDEDEWEIINPSQWSDGTPVQAALSRIEKARRVFSGRMHTENGPLEESARSIGLRILIGVAALTLLILVPILLVALR